MAECAITAPSIKINNLTVAIIGNSATYTDGFGESDNIPQSAGGNSVQMVVTRDVSTFFSTVKFSLKNTNNNAELVRTWKSRNGNNLIEIDGQIELTALPFSRSFQDADLTNDVEIGLGSDSEIELEWKTAPAI